MCGVAGIMEFNVGRFDDRGEETRIYVLFLPSQNLTQTKPLIGLRATRKRPG
jgi:hypothetical protein